MIAGLGTLAAVAACGGSAIAPAAAAAPVPLVATVRVAPLVAAAPKADLDFPGGPTWHVQDRKPPLTKLLRAYLLVHTRRTPHQFHAVITLYRYRRAIPIGGNPTWVARRYGKAVHLGLGDLAAPGSSVTWKLGGGIYPPWFCRRGHYFIAISIHGVSTSNTEWHYLFYSPFAPGSKVDTGPHSHYGTRPPDYEQAHKVTCRG